MLFSENVFLFAFLPAVLFISGAVFFLRLARYVFRPRFFLLKLKERNGGEKTSLSSLWLALGGTLGVGNICGVCAAIYVGGAGCVFWIWVCAFFSAATKYAETVLAIDMREIAPCGDTFGGAPSYIKKGLGLTLLPKLFCVLCIFTAFSMGNVTQIKSASELAGLTLELPKLACAFIFGILVLIFTLGKGKAISAFTSKAVPFLCIFYTLLCCINVFAFRDGIIPLTKRIITEAFTPRAGAGGWLAFLSSPALRLGVTRGIMSNEAGCGTAPIAYASDKNASPVRSGMLGIAEVLVDTLILCTLTAYAVLLPGIPLSESSAKTVINAFSAVTGEFTSALLGVSVAVFALASTASWAFYALSSAAYLGLKDKAVTVFSVLYSTCAFLAPFAEEGAVWVLADLSISLMAIINTVAITLMFGRVKRLTVKEYQKSSIHRKN